MPLTCRPPSLAGVLCDSGPNVNLMHDLVRVILVRKDMKVRELAGVTGVWTCDGAATDRRCKK